MEYDQSLGSLRGEWKAPRNVPLTTWRKWVAHVVVGEGPQAGSIKSVRFDHTQPSNPIFRAEFRSLGPTQGYMCRSLTIHQELRDRGWFFVDRAFEVEGLTEEHAEWKSYVEACREGKVHVEKGADGRPAEPSLAPGFPDELLPRRVLETARRRDRRTTAWKPSMTKSKAKPAKKAEANGSSAP